MNQYIVLLRGVNVSGHNLLPMKELKKVMEVAGFESVATYIQSGNIVFNSNESNIDILKSLIIRLIQKHFNLSISVFILSRKQLIEIINNSPFKDEEDTKKLYYIILEQSPSVDLIEKLKIIQYPPDEYFIQDSVIYLNCHNGYGNTKFSNNFFENKLKLNATTRNWNTFQKLIEMTD